MKETAFSKRFIDEYMRPKFPHMWDLNVHGHDMQKMHVPDYLFCINSLFVAMEFKVQRDSRISITPGQIKELNNIKNANGIALLIGYDEKKHRLLMREKRLDYKKIFFSGLSKPVKTKTIRIDWDFEFTDYEPITDLIGVMVENKAGLLA